MTRTLGWFLLLTVVLITLLAALMQSAWLRDRVLALGLDAATESWSLERAEGRLLTGITLHGLKLETEAASLDVKRLDFRPALERLSMGELAVRDLVLSGVTIHLKETEAPVQESEPSGFPELDFSFPLPVRLSHLAIHGLTVTRQEQTLVSGLGAAVSLQGRGRTLSAQRLRILWPDQGLRASGAGTLELRPSLAHSLSLQLTRHPASADEPPVHLELDAEGALEAVEGVVRVDAPTRGELQFQVAPESLETLITGEFEGLDWQQAERADVGLERLGLRLEGNPEGMDWQIDASGSWRDQQAGFRGRGNASRQALEIETARLELGELQANLIAALDLLGSQPRFSAELSASDVDISPWQPDWPTRLDIATRLNGTLPSADQPLELAVEQLRVDGDWNGVPASLDAVLQLEPDDALAINLQQLQLDLGDNHIEANGRVAHQLALELSADLPDLSQVWPQLEGSLNTEAQASGQRQQPRLTLDGSASNLILLDYRVDEASWSGMVDLSADEATRLEVSARDAWIGGTRLHTELQLTGTWPTLRLDADTRLPDLEIAVQAQAGADVSRPEQVELSRLTIDLPLVDRWQMNQPVMIDWQTDPMEVQVSAACLADGASAELCWQPLAVTADGNEVDAQLDGFQLALLAPFLPSGLETEGQLNARLQMDQKQLQLQASANGSELRVIDPELTETVYEDRFERLTLSLRQNGDRVEALLDARADTAGELRLDGVIDLPEAGLSAFTDARLDLSATLGIDSLAPFTPLLPGSARADGTLRGEFQLQGSAADPRLSGDTTLNGSVSLPDLGLEIRPLRVRLETTPDSPLMFSGEAVIEGRPLQLKAQADWGLEAGLSLEGSLQGNKVPLALGPDIHVTLSPDLKLQYGDEGMRMNGIVRIPEARIRAEGLPAGGGDGGETLSADVVVHDAEGERTDTQLPVWLDLELALGDAVNLSASGLKTRLVGNLRLRQTPEQPLTARGQLETRDGRFKAYGQDLDIRRGRLNFDGPMDNPAVDVLAVRTIENSEVGVQVTGFANALETRIHSSPERDEATALTMLITGRMPGEASSADMARVSDAALSYGLNQAVPVVGRLVNQLGIDELALDSPMDEEQGAVKIGSQVTDDIFVRYIYGLHSRLGGLQIEYRLTDWLSIQSETGTSQAIDLIFRREFR